MAKLVVIEVTALTTRTPKKPSFYSAYKTFPSKENQFLLNLSQKCYRSDLNFS